MSKSIVAAVVLAASVAACAPITTTTVVDPSAPPSKVETDIVKACTASGLFKVADGLVASAVPQATLPVQVVNAGVDQVCADPARFAHAVDTAVWVARNLKDILAKKQGA